MSTGKAAAGHGISGFFPGRIAGRGGPLPGCPAQHPAADRLYYSRMACTETNISLYIVAFRLCANFALWPLFAQRLFERCMVKKVVCVQDNSPLSESCTQQKAPPTEGKVSTGLIGNVSERMLPSGRRERFSRRRSRPGCPASWPAPPRRAPAFRAGSRSGQTRW